MPPQVADELIASGQAEPTVNNNPTHKLLPENGEYDSETPDAADWALDDAAADFNENGVMNSTTKPEATQETSPNIAVSEPLPFPIIIPQRRPGTKSRGFVRAYTLVLESKGFTQDIFLGFLEDFYTAVQASPIFDVVMIATAIAGAYLIPWCLLKYRPYKS